jgi:TonB-linked SusC/RagA family outer membrane protein
MKKKWDVKNVGPMLLLAFLLLITISSYAQQRIVKGTVKDRQGNPISGATIQVVDATNLGTTSDKDGKFSLPVPQSANKLLVSSVGMQSKQVEISTNSSLDVVLTADIRNLDEVVVVGYQTVKRKDLTGAVSSVAGKDIAAAPVANAAQAIQGKLPGVSVVTQDGRPDAAVAIRVRGGGSISQSNDPLILVDGISIGSLSDIPVDQIASIDVLKDASSTAIYGARGANGVILVTTKSAKAGKTTVTYNGYVKVNTPTKYLKAMDPYDYLKYVWANAAANGSAYQTPFEELYGLGAHAGNNTGGLDSYKSTPVYDLQKKVYNSSVSHNHDITLSGGTDKTKIFFAGNFIDEQGMKLNSSYKRANISFKANQKLFENVDINLDVRYTDVSDLGNEGTTNGSGSLLSSSYKFRPIAMENILGDTNAIREGNMEQYGKTSTWDRYSSLNRIKDYDPLSLNQELRGTIAMNWRIIKGLTYHTDFYYSKGWSQTKIWSGAIYNNYLDDATGEKLYAGAVDYSKSDSWSDRWSNTLNFDKIFGDIHHVNILAGQEISNSGGTAMRITANHFPANFSKDNAFAMINQYDQDAGTMSFSSGISTPNRLLSYFGRANYSLMDRYLFTITMRADGSSRFAPTKRWGYFPAAAAAWRISDESFMKKASWLDDLKLRASYGQVGNDGISSDLWSQLWTSETDRRWQYVLNNQYQTAYDLASEQMANGNLKWETTITRNLGLDFTLFHRRLQGTIDVYKNTTKDLLMLTSIPGITGFTSTYANIGQTSNKGIEISLSANIYSDKNWNVTAAGNINFNKGNVDKLASNITGLYGTQWASTSTYPAADYILKVGSPVGLVRGLVYDGFYTTKDFDYANGAYTLKQGVADVGNFIGPVHGVGSTERPGDQIAYPGLVKYKDLNGDGVINDQDLTVIGNTNPVHTGGFNLNVSYKSLDLGAYFNWSYGNDVYNVNKLASLYGYKETGVYENKLAILNNAYKIYDIQDGQLVRLSTPEQLDAANKNATLPLAYNESGVTSSLGIESGSFLRLNTVTLGYSFSKELLHKIGLNSLRVYASVYNLLTITGYSGLDPEVNANTAQGHAVYPTTGLDWGSYPRARSFVFGLNLNF